MIDLELLSPYTLDQYGHTEDTEKAELIAQILTHVFGSTVSLDDDADDDADHYAWNTWDEKEHPRDRKGQFAKKEGRLADVSAIIGKLLSGKPSATSAGELADHLSMLTVKELHALKKQHGIKASGVKKDLVDKLAKRLDAGRRADFSMEPEKPKPTIRDAIRDAGLSLTSGQKNGRVRLADLRGKLSDFPRAEIDRELLAMERAGDLSLFGLDNPSEITESDRAAVLKTPAGSARHIAYFAAPKRASQASQAKGGSKSAVKMEDFGEYIPGARKEGAKKRGTKASSSDAEGEKKPAWMKPFEISQIVKSSNKSEEDKWSITSKKHKDWFGQPRQVGLFDTREEAEKALPLLAVAENHDVRKSSDGTYAIHRRIAKGKYPIVKGGFDSEDAAKRYIAANPVSVLEHKFQSYESLQYLDEVKRDGPSIRGGKDVGADEFRKDFSIRGAQFGNWQSGKDGQTSLNHAFDSFHDLADALGLDKSAITLDGRLALGFGSQGTGGKNAARAHYDPGKQFINLTKMAGAGSLAHEWAHALDHMIAGSTQQKNGSSAVAMESWSLKKHARPEVVDAVKHLFDTMTTKSVEEAVQAPVSRFTEKALAEAAEERKTAKEYNRPMSYPKTIEDHMWNLKKHLEDTARWKKKTLKPEDVAEFDRLSAQVAGGDYGDDLLVETRGYGGRLTFKNLEKLNELHRKMAGRGFHTSDDHSIGNKIYHAINSEKHMKQREQDAATGKKETRRKRTSFMEEAVQLDKQRVGDYYTQPEEMMARAFEAYISDKLSEKGRRSDYLIGKGKTNNTPYRMAGIGAPFPEGLERHKINAAFDQLFDVLKGHELKPGNSDKYDWYSMAPAELEGMIV